MATRNLEQDTSTATYCFSEYILVMAMLVAALVGGIAAGKYGYAKDISNTDHFVIWLWFLIIPAGGLVVAWCRAKVNIRFLIAFFLAPFLLLPGFLLVYRHPDIIRAGLLFAFVSMFLNLISYYFGKKISRKIPRLYSISRKLWLVVITSTAIYLLVCFIFIILPIDVIDRPSALRYKGQGILNSAATDSGVAYDNYMYFSDKAVLGDMMERLAGIGVLGAKEVTGGFARRQLKGPLFGFLQIREKDVLSR